MATALSELWPILLYFVFTLALLVGVMALSSVLGPRNMGHSTHVPYESGVIPFGEARVKFANHFFLYAIFFVIFDVETLFLFAWAISFEQVGLAGFIEAFIFILILMAALIYLWRIGAMDVGRRHLKKSNEAK